MHFAKQNGNQRAAHDRSSAGMKQHIDFIV
jgi:hypothetical protein